MLTGWCYGKPCTARWHGVAGAAIDHTFRLVDAPPLKAALAGSLDACAFVVSDGFYSDVVYHHQDARPDIYRKVGCEVKGVQLSAWLRAEGQLAWRRGVVTLRDDPASRLAQGIRRINGVGVRVLDIDGRPSVGVSQAEDDTSGKVGPRL